MQCNNRRTYILTNLEHKPLSSPIQLGAILAHPFKPTKPLSKPRSPPAIEAVVQSSYSISRTSSKTIHGGVKATLLTLVDINPKKSGKAVGTTQSFEIDTLETRWLREEPQDNDSDLLTRLQEPKVQAAIDGGLFGKQPVYLVSGLKIARGLLAHCKEDTSTTVAVDCTVHVAEGIAAGIGLEVERGSSGNITFRIGPDEEIIFAYQVHEIRLGGRKRNKLTANIFETDSAFLHEEDGNTNIHDITVSPLSVETWMQEEAEEGSDSEADEGSTEVAFLPMRGGDGLEYLQFQGDKD